jgi:glycosyltransferase involved in cell wall biosynthesis
MELRRSDVFIHASLEDNSPNAIAEALCCGVAVFSSSSGGSGELIGATGGGRTFGVGEDTALAELMVRGMQDWSWIARQKSAAAGCGNLVNFERIADQHLSAYTHIMEQDGRRARNSGR